MAKTKPYNPEPYVCRNEDCRDSINRFLPFEREYVVPSLCYECRVYKHIRETLGLTEYHEIEYKPSMKITKNSPPPVVQPPPTYTLTLSQEEFNDLLEVANWHKSVAEYIIEENRRAGYKKPEFTRNTAELSNKPTVESISKTLSRLWDLKVL